MMNLIEMISFCLMGGLCILCTKSDLSNGIIRNKVLAVFFGCAIALAVLYYGVFAGDLFREFVLNLTVVSAVSLYLFYSHSFAGGDCKFTIVLAMLYPARCYWIYGNSSTTLIFAIGFAVFAGYCYLLASSIWAILSKKVKITREYVKGFVLSFLKSYLAAMLYISLVNSILLFIYHRGYSVNVWISRALCLAIAWCVGRFWVFKRWEALIPTGIIVAVLSIVLKNVPFSLNPENYTLTLILLLCQMTIKTTLYEKVPVAELKKGMILSSFSSMLMQASITKGLPGVSTEDLKSRLTSEEIESIRIWAKATHTESLTIVKKIPFAIFISIGFLCYCILGSILAWA